MELLYDYKMVDNRSVVEQAHEIQALAKELEQFLCELPDRFVAGGIIAKLTPSWRDFATSLEHKRQQFSVADLIGTLDVEEKARAKDSRGKGIESSSANIVRKENSNAYRNNKKKKNKQNNLSKPKQTATFKKEKTEKGGCFVCGSTEHWASACPDCKFNQEKKSANMVVSGAGEGTSGYGRRDWSLVDGEWVACACSWCWYGRSEVYFGKDGAIEERAACMDEVGGCSGSSHLANSLAKKMEEDFRNEPTKKISYKAFQASDGHKADKISGGAYGYKVSYDEIGGVPCGYGGKGVCISFSDRVTYAYKVSNIACNISWHLSMCELRLRMHEMLEKLQSSVLPTEAAVLSNWKYDRYITRCELVGMIVLHELPFSFVEYEGFRRYSASLNPLAKTVSRTAIKENCLEAYKNQRVVPRDTFGGMNCRFSLTADLWTSNQNIGYICITCHYIDNDWKVQKKIIKFCVIKTPHDAFNIYTVMQRTIRFFNIEDKLFSITLDNAGVNKSMIDCLQPSLLTRGLLHCDGDLFHVRCACHVLNLIVKDGLLEIDDKVYGIRESVKFLRSSQSRKEIIEELGIHCGRRPSLDVAMRWNSTCDMLESALPFKDAFHELGQRDHNYMHCPSTDGWQKAEVVCSLLKVFKKATEVLSGSKYPTSNLYFHEIWSVRQVLEEEASSTNSTTAAMVLEMKSKFQKYWDISYLTNCIPVILDPRFKFSFIEFRLQQAYGNHAGVHIAKVDKAIRSLFSGYSSHMGDTFSSSTQENQQVAVPKSHSWSDWRQHTIGRSNQGTSELDKYLQEDLFPCDDDDFDILHWWKMHTTKYPTVPCMAHDVLAVPASTVASESAFSTSGRIINNYWTTLASNTVEALDPADVPYLHLPARTSRSWQGAEEGLAGSCRTAKMCWQRMQHPAGYAFHGVGYRFLIINSGVSNMLVGTIMESRDATFFESEFPMKNAPSTSSREYEIPHEHFNPIEHFEEPHEQNPKKDDNVATRKSKRQRTAKSFGDDYIVYLVDDTPKTIEEAYSSPDADLWKEEGANGCSRKSLGLMVPLRVSHGLLVHQTDVKTVFLNGELDEETYMDQPAGFVAKGQEGMVCKLLKSLYGLKQAPKQWHEKFDETLTSAGFVVNDADKCVYYRYGGGQRVILCLYVDNILIFGTNLDVIKEVKDFLSNHFEMKDLGKPDVILNIKLLREGNGGVTLVQSHYMEKVDMCFYLEVALFLGCLASRLS
ncbi:hypothetical protein U9M48_004472 [Paspalum notatum var. saurae]|uniref:CCHC-type domain-containing protein n=1 Tax=Paspalum notatum var. saurae TaxID=547442 RepID=A0AAQ3PNS3_PASNO